MALGINMNQYHLTETFRTNLKFTERLLVPQENPLKVSRTFYLTRFLFLIILLQ